MSRLEKGTGGAGCIVEPVEQEGGRFDPELFFGLDRIDSGTVP